MVTSQPGRTQPTSARVKPANLRRWGATVRGTYGMPEAGTRRLDVQCVGPWGQAALRLRRTERGSLARVGLTCQLSRSTKRCQARSSAEGRLGSSESDSGACART